MEDSSSDSDHDALFQKITSKFSKIAQRSAKKRKKLKGKVSKEKENQPVKNDCKRSENVGKNFLPVKSTKDCADLYKLFEKSSGGSKTMENGQQCFFKSLKPNSAICNILSVESGQQCLFKSLKPIEISNRSQQSCTSEYSDTSFIEDIGVPLIESTRIHSRESISAMNLDDSTFFSIISNPSKHFSDETFQSDSYERLNQETKSAALQVMLNSPDTGNKPTSLGIASNGKNSPTNQDNAVTVVSESEDDEKFYSVLEEGSFGVNDRSPTRIGLDCVEESSSGSSYEVEDTSMQTDVGLNGSVKSACNSDRDFKTNSICNDEEESFVEVLDTSMQTEHDVRNEESAGNKSKEEIYGHVLNREKHTLDFLNEIRSFNLVSLRKNKENYKKVLTMTDESSNNSAMRDNLSTSESWRSKQALSESSEDEDLDNFFQRMRSSSSRQRCNSSSSSDSEIKYDTQDMDGFIVNDDEVISGNDDDECFHITMKQSPSYKPSRKPQALRTKKGKDSEQKKSSTNDPHLSSSDSDIDFLILTHLTPRFKKSVSAPGKKTSPPDSDYESLLPPVSKTPVKSSAVKQRKNLPGGDCSKEDDVEYYSFLRSLTSDTLTEHRRDPEALKYIIDFMKHKDELTQRLFTLFNATVFENKLPTGFEIEWNKRLLRTAGYCSYKSGHVAKIRLSTKVCDTAERVRDTLIHELCHAAVWVVNHTKDGHGFFWKHWALKANKCHPEIAIISRCHSYSIFTKFTYECTQCGYSVGRHSKSLDTDKKVCGRCHGKFELRLSSRMPNKFASFVKSNYADLRKKDKGLTDKEIMHTLSIEFGEKNRINNAK